MDAELTQKLVADYKVLVADAEEKRYGEYRTHLGWMDRVTATTLRFRLFTTGGIISQTGGITTIRLSVPEDERPWWLAVFDKILSLIPNCNAVGARPG